ncbi:MAG: hypothetical protein J2P34_08240, partial [Actinobacteria bacterium]|nr:hypothetical protein [Actinomycetota bacterium]
WAYGQTAALDDLLAEATPPAGTPAGRTASRPDVGRRAPAGGLRIRALGEASVHCGERLLAPADWGWAKPRELLFLLVSSPPRSKADIGLALWPDLDAQQLRNAFHTALRDLRRALGDPSWVVFSAGRYTIDRSRDHWCDLEIFEEALAAARQARPAAAALPHLQRAISAYGGEFGAGLPDAEWLQQRRAGLGRAFSKALAATGRLLISGGRPREAVGVCRRAAGHDPLDEAAHRQLMTALVRSGEAGQAAQVYQQLADRLHTELGIAPAAETRAVYQQLRQAR